MQRKSHSHLAAGALCDRRYLGEEGKDGVLLHVGSGRVKPQRANEGMKSAGLVKYLRSEGDWRRSRGDAGR